MPSMGMPAHAVTTQPMTLPPRPSATTAPPIPAGQKAKSTQRLIVTPNAAGKLTSSSPLPADVGTIPLPVGMILRCLPPEMLGGALTEFEASGAAATEIPISLQTILSQLPSGKVELPVRDLVPLIPAGFLKSHEEIGALLGTVVSLPLMDVVMRIPPNLLAVRPDQKDVDPSVRRMADPFAGEQVPAAPPAEARIVEESQVPPTEEFVPQASQSLPPTPSPTETQSTKSFVPPSRLLPVPLLNQTASLSGRPAFSRPMAPTRIVPAEGAYSRPPASTLSASQTLGVPRPPSPLAGASASGPLEPRISPIILPTPPASSIAVTAPMPASALPVASIPPFTPPTPKPPETDAGELKRLAALAMEQMDAKSDEEKPSETSEIPAAPEPAAAEPTAPESTPTMVLPKAPAELAPDEAEVPDLKQFSFAAPAPVPVPDKPAQPIAATSRFKLPEIPAAQTTPINPVETAPTAHTTRFAPPMPAPASSPAPAPLTESQTLASSQPAPAVAINLNNCSPDDLLPIPGMTRSLAAAIVTHRDKLGEFHKLEELLDVPGMTRDIYANLTGETPSSGVHPSINELLGFPLENELSLKDVTDRICCWPDVTGCLLSQKNGLHLVGTAPDFLDKEAIVAFAPRMFEDVNKSFSEITGKQTDELTIPTTGTSFHLLREKELYMIILSRLPQMPERHLKIARFVLAGLSSRPS
jgi:DNA uptake protein ComE-like DNA-binding protein